MGWRNKSHFHIGFLRSETVQREEISELLAPSVRGRQGQTMRNIHSTKWQIVYEMHLRPEGLDLSTQQKISHDCWSPVTQRFFHALALPSECSSFFSSRKSECLSWKTEIKFLSELSYMVKCDGIFLDFEICQAPLNFPFFLLPHIYFLNSIVSLLFKALWLFCAPILSHFLFLTLRFHLWARPI